MICTGMPACLPRSVEAELPDEGLEAVARSRVEADLRAHALLGLLEAEGELVVHLREIGEGPLHLHAVVGRKEGYDAARMYDM